MDWKISETILGDIRAGCAADRDLADLREQLLRRAIQYARQRTDWSLSTLEERQRIDPVRKSAHNVLIDACNMLSRAMAKAGKDVTWRERLGDDRKEIGDFACYAHAILGIAAR